MFSGIVIALVIVANGWTPDLTKPWKGFGFERDGLKSMMSRKNNSQDIKTILAIFGSEDAEELTAKAALALKLNELINKRGLSQIETAAITGMTQPKVSQIRHYNFQNISLERLMQALVSLDQHVEIVVQPARLAHVRGITVTA